MEMDIQMNGLKKLKRVPDAIPYLVSDKVVELMTKHEILTKEELESRCEIFLENYNKLIHIEAVTMAEMVRKDVTSGIVSYSSALGKEIKEKTEAAGVKCQYEKHILSELDKIEDSIFNKLTKLTDDTEKAEVTEDVLQAAKFYHETILTDMEELRKYVDEAEKLIPEEYLSYPTYGKLLFSLR